MAINIQLRRGTATEWSTANPTLAVAEMGIETDTNLFKIGDGATPWNTLAYGGLNGTFDGNQILTSSSDKSANYTLVSADKNTYIRSTGSAITITVPDVLANGESINFIQAGAGQITFTGSGVTINSKEAKLKTKAQFSAATVTKVGGAYYLIGDLD
jgi:hypothetical protein